ncbi:hypothetical protein DQ04_00921000, partial [Trypanosoma grayi]|uniref:hypothetical protein n=1 Tax=Trypanosoma grayi TaxID=71804 RepID=UPI0004F3F666
TGASPFRLAPEGCFARLGREGAEVRAAPFGMQLARFLCSVFFYPSFSASAQPRSPARGGGAASGKRSRPPTAGSAVKRIRLRRPGGFSTGPGACGKRKALGKAWPLDRAAFAQVKRLYG